MMYFLLYPVSQILQKTVKIQSENKKEPPFRSIRTVGAAPCIMPESADYFFVAYWKKKYPREVNPTLSMLLSLQYSWV